MPLPEQLLDRLGREPVQTPGWSSQLLMFSGTVFFISIAVYFGIVFGYKPYLQKEVAALDNQIKTFGKQIPQEEQNKLVSFYSQIVNLQEILQKHVISSKLFAWLEKNTEAGVYFTKFNLAAPTSQINLSGVAKTIDDFSKQIIIFQNDKLVSRISINSVLVSPSGAWQFSVTLLLADGALTQQASAQ